MTAPVVVTCARGTERALKFELKALGFTALRSASGAVTGEGPPAAIAGANIWSRVASRVLIELGRVEAADERALVQALAQLPWEQWLPEGHTFAATAHLRSAPTDHTLHATRLVKDGVCDRMRERGLGRPTVDTKAPTYRFVLFWEGTEASVSLDTSGASLGRRNYRPRSAEAPMRETLAAAILALGHADVRRPFRDPCCGSGTLAVEQAFRSMDRAPGLERRLAPDRWPADPFELKGPLAEARAEARERVRARPQERIVASDWHPAAIESCHASLRDAGLEGLVEVERVDARKAAYDEGGVVVANLPFGERVGGGPRAGAGGPRGGAGGAASPKGGKRGGALQLAGFYRTLGEALGELAGTRLLLFTAHPDAESLLGLGRPLRRWSLYSGQMKAMLRRWDLDAADVADSSNDEVREAADDRPSGARPKGSRAR